MFMLILSICMGLAQWLSGKESACNAGDPSSTGPHVLPGNRTISTQGRANVSESPFCKYLGLWNKSQSPHTWPSTSSFQTKFSWGRGEEGEFHGVGLGWELGPDAELSGNSALPTGVFMNDFKGPCWRKCYHIPQLRVACCTSGRVNDLEAHVAWSCISVWIKGKGEQLYPQYSQDVTI